MAGVKRKEGLKGLFHAVHRLTAMFSVKLYKSSLVLRGATWLALGSLALWRIGYEGLQRGFWEGRHWNLGHLVDPSNYNEYGFPTPKLTYVLEALAWSALEIASAAVGTVVALEVINWVKQGFASNDKNDVASDPPVEN